jgi:predicted lipoprotein with Yx(FWY)xxD motif
MRSATAVASGALILAALMPATASSARAQGTPLGRYAASCVDQAIFEHVHGNVLYTHDGDNKGTARSTT